MIKMIHHTTGIEMWVPEDQMDKFLERGHVLAPVPVPEKKAPKKPVKKRTTKK